MPMLGIVTKLPLLLHEPRETSTLPRKKSLSRYLRDARVERGLSVLEVAERVGVSTVSVYLWETGRVRPRDENLSALCKVLKLPVRATKEMAGG